MRLFLLGLVVWLFALGFLAWVAIVAGAIPINADSAPPLLERWAARTAVIAGVNRRVTHGKNPASGEDAVHDGIRLYRGNCEACHGDGRGDAQPFANGLYQKPPQFAKDGIEDLPYSYTSWVIRHGIRLTGMPAFSSLLSQRQIDDVALFLKRMKDLTPDERFAWSGAPIRPELRAAFSELGGFRACVYIPSPGARPHHFVSTTSKSEDGAFIVEHFYNRGISELAVIGLDSRHNRLVRTQLAKDGAADIAVASLDSRATVWDNRSGTKTTVSRAADGSYAFRSTGAPGFGRCQRRTDAG